jgi:hypothetical protein
VRSMLLWHKWERNDLMNGRHLMFVSEINPTAFVFFYALGERSYSVRDYQHPSKDFLETVAEIVKKPPTSVSDTPRFLRMELAVRQSADSR